MNNTIYKFNAPINEPIKNYCPCSKESERLKEALEKLSENPLDIPVVIGGKEIRTGNLGTVVMPHDHHHVIATYHIAGKKEAQMAIEAALEAKKTWESFPWVERASIMLKAAELIATKYRYVINAATMLSQSKSVFQAEIDAACETVDFLRYNAYFASTIYAEQPKSELSSLNRLEYRPLEGFVYAISPFNFTSISANLNTAPALMGNVTIWKPSTTAVLSNYILFKVFEEAGMPAGVINFLPAEGPEISEVLLKDKNLAAIHFTGSTKTMKRLWLQVAENLDTYKSYPRIVGETGGKDFIFAHSSADIEGLSTAIIRGAFEYQGQKCSAASRAYIPKSIWNELEKLLVKGVKDIKVGDVKDFSNFMNAVIDEKAFDRIMGYIDVARYSKNAELLCGGFGDKSVGYFIEPTIIVTNDPHFISMEEEIFGPVMTVFLYEDEAYEETLKLCDETSPYGLTGAIFSQDRYAVSTAMEILKYAAGNFYINDKPSGAVVGMQPFGGSRASGTNDKAGFAFNLLRWVSPRTIKETFVPPTDYKYPFMREISCKESNVSGNISCV